MTVMGRSRMCRYVDASCCWDTWFQVVGFVGSWAVDTKAVGTREQGAMGCLDMRFKIPGAWDDWAVEAQSFGHPVCRMLGALGT